MISAAGEWNTPALIALCEVENDSVLSHLTRRTPLRWQDYRYIITQSPDPRGINVALLYQRDQFFYLRHESIPIRFSGNKHKLTRDILHVYGKIITGDTLDVFVCHFPSRYGGEKESEKDRFDAARTLRGSSDSLLLIREKPQILIMGDFNDTPQDRGISDLITQESSMHIIPESIHIFAPDFLLTKDKTWRGVRPFRTYYGFKYEGGFSDHLPLTVDFLIRSQIKR